MGSVNDFQPLPSALGVNKAFISDQPTTLVLKEQFSVSDDDFSIKTIAGEEVLRCNGKFMSMTSRKEFSTPTGEHLFSLRREIPALHKSWYLERPNGERFVDLQGRFSIGKAKIDVKFKNTVAGGSPVVLEIRGSFTDRKCDILWDGKPVAFVRRSFFNLSKIFADMQTYGMEVAPGVDLSLMAACCIAIEEERD